MGAFFVLAGGQVGLTRRNRCVRLSDKRQIAKLDNFWADRKPAQHSAVSGAAAPEFCNLQCRNTSLEKPLVSGHGTPLAGRLFRLGNRQNSLWETMRLKLPNLGVKCRKSLKSINPAGIATLIFRLQCFQGLPAQFGSPVQRVSQCLFR